MIINSDNAYDLLMEAKKINDQGYIDHSLVVGEAASRIAKSLNLDEDKARTLGYIHDIGKLYGLPLEQHTAKGYEYLINLNIDKEYANICLSHSYLNNDIDCTAKGKVPKDSYKYEFRKQFIINYEYTIYDKIICLCDLMCTNKFMILEERLIELMERTYDFSNTRYHIEYSIKLKEEIESLLGFSIYKLFPEINNRLFS